MLNESMFSSESEDWNTPEWLVNIIRAYSCVGIGLDPCSNANSFVRAKTEWIEGALERTWRGYGFVFCNPPYGRGLSKWADHIARDWKESNDKDQLLLLIPARTDTNWWHDCISSAAAVVFFKGRLKFGAAVNSAPFPSALIYFGTTPRNFIEMFGPFGWAVQLRQ